MDRNRHRKYIPECPRSTKPIEAYMWKEKDTNDYMCFNGISHPIYDCKGEINYSLPLEFYPRVGEVHPQIAMTRRMHLNWRGEPVKKVFFPDKRTEGFRYDNDDYKSGRTEGFYSNGNLPMTYPSRLASQEKSGLRIISDKVPGYPLPSPYGDTKSGNCYSCS